MKKLPKTAVFRLCLESFDEKIALFWRVLPLNCIKIVQKGDPFGSSGGRSLRRWRFS